MGLNSLYLPPLRREFHVRAETNPVANITPYPLKVATLSGSANIP
jgi:hypothetical protein